MEVLQYIGNLRTPFFDKVFSITTLLGEEMVILTVMCLIFWCIDKRLAYRIGLTFFLSGLLVQGLKITFRIERPWVIDENFDPVEGSMETATGYSFPSGHTQTAAGMYMPIGLYTKKLWLRIVCFALAVLVGFSRIYLGVHTLNDVAASLIVTLAIALAVHFLMDKMTKKSNLVFSIIMLVFAIGVFVYSVILNRLGIIEESYVTDCCKAAAAGVGFAIGYYVERNYIEFDTKTDKLYMQIVKFIAGMGGALIIKEGLKMIIGTSLVADSVRYMLLVLWVIAFFPLIIKTVSKKTKSRRAAVDKG